MKVFTFKYLFASGTDIVAYISPTMVERLSLLKLQFSGVGERITWTGTAVLEVAKRLHSELWIRLQPTTYTLLKTRHYFQLYAMVTHFELEIKEKQHSESVNIFAVEQGQLGSDLEQIFSSIVVRVFLVYLNEYSVLRYM